MNSLFVICLVTLLSLISADICQLRTKNKAKYGYDPASGHGPDDWGKMKGYGLCKRGAKQSPIDFKTTVNFKPLKLGPKPQLRKAAMKLKAGNNNWGMECKDDKMDTCGWTVFNGVKYRAFNIHFHHPSEHTLNGERFPLESHIVHKSNSGKYLVIGTMFKYPDNSSYTNTVHQKKDRMFGANPLINQCMGSVLKGKSAFKISLPFIMNPTAGICTYIGSFTTPPCTEKVTWVMQLGVQTISKSQVNDYMLSAGCGLYGNNRPTKPMNGRKITCYI